MQGYANKKYDLPRPYSLKPKHRKANSNVDRLATNYFTSPKRKLLGYLLLMVLFSICLLTFIKPDDDDYEYELDLTNDKSSSSSSLDGKGNSNEMLIKSNIKKGSQKRPLDDEDSDFDELLETVEKELKESKINTKSGSRVDAVKGATKGKTSKKVGSGSEGDDGLENDAEDSLTEEDYIENIGGII